MVFQRRRGGATMVVSMISRASRREGEMRRMNPIFSVTCEFQYRGQYFSLFSWLFVYIEPPFSSFLFNKFVKTGPARPVQPKKPGTGPVLEPEKPGQNRPPVGRTGNPADPVLG